MSAVDVDLHGVNLRLLDARLQDVHLVQRQFPGMEFRPSAASPDVVVRFVDALVMHGQVSRIGGDLVDDEGVVLVRRGKGRAARARVPVGQRDAVVVCERHIREVPLLVHLIRMAAVDKGLLALHAVAFTHRGIGVAATGWSGSGKTALLLAMMAGGAHPVAAEWVLVSQDGSRLLGVPQAVRLKPSHVDRWAELAGPAIAAGGARRRLLSALRPVASRVAPRTKAFVERALRVDVPLQGLHRGKIPAGKPEDGPPTAPFDVLVMLEDAEVSEVNVERIGSDFAAERIAIGLEHDLAELQAASAVLRYASGRPLGAPFGPTDTATRRLLARHLESRPVFLLRHRQPTPFETLRLAVERAIA